MNLSTHVKTKRLKIDGTNFQAAAGTSDLTSEAIDTQGFEGVRIITAFGALTSTAVTSTKLQQCDTSGGSYADLAGSKIDVADDDDNQVTVHDIFRPRERFLKLVIDRGTANAVVDGAIVEFYGPIKKPTTDDTATVVAREVHISPAEGTA